MITLPASQDAVALVDWLEVSLLAQNTSRISDTAIIDVFSEADLDEDPDALLASMHQTVRMRENIVGATYPVERQGLGYSRRGDWKDYLPYSFMLFTSLNQSYTELNYGGGTANKPAELFEVLASKAVERYLQCSVIRIGAPRRKPVPPSFPEALTYTVEELGEIVGQRDLERHNSGDDGVDLIGWRPFGDARASQAIILAQCAIGTDWRDKRDDISLRMWQRHIDWHSTPLKGIAVPFHHQEGNSWRETATRAGIIFDRLRIAKLVDTAALPAPTKKEMMHWCEKRLKKVAKLAIEQR
ncbi:hypothetical protein [Methyloceanibacter sp.]|uniref:hypothetical protein n=1 Tax=Methyloceanibacter sp. TaxID=1965321 RepID=UPI003D6CB0CB